MALLRLLRGFYMREVPNKALKLEIEVVFISAVVDGS